MSKGESLGADERRTPAFRRSSTCRSQHERRLTLTLDFAELWSEPLAVALESLLVGVGGEVRVLRSGRRRVRVSLVRVDQHQGLEQRLAHRPELPGSETPFEFGFGITRGPQDGVLEFDAV
jgi:hypothetical protein